MTSILAKQPPHSSPWPPMRVRQAMQTGGKRRSAKRPKSGRIRRAPAGTLAGEAATASMLNPASPIFMPL
jgi:hypothetical protein